MKNVFDYIVVFVAGVTVGATTASIIFKRQEEKKVDDKVNEIINELQRANEDLKETDFAQDLAETKNKIRYNEMFNADAVKPADKPTIFEENSVEAGMKITQNPDDPEDIEDEDDIDELHRLEVEDWEAKHKKRFELIKKEDYEANDEPIDYDHIELVQLADMDIITEDGDEVNDIEEARGLLDKIGFSTSNNEEEDVYLRDNKFRTNYVIHNAPDMTREDYLGL